MTTQLMYLIRKIKKYINDLDYALWSNRIMSDAIEFSEDAYIVDAYLYANYENHYGKGQIYTE